MNAKRKILEKIVRVDQAGEVGAQQIYEGQKLVFKTLKNKKDFDQISRMAGEEKEHLDYFNELAKKESIKPTRLSNLFGVGAFAMGIGTALLGRKAAYVCTEAVEEVIEAHYQKQIDELEDIHDDVREKIIKFQEDEVEHKNTAINQGSQQTFGYSILRKTINETTKLAIFMAERYYYFSSCISQYRKSIQLS